VWTITRALHSTNLHSMYIHVQRKDANQTLIADEITLASELHSQPFPQQFPVIHQALQSDRFKVSQNVSDEAVWLPSSNPFDLTIVISWGIERRVFVLQLPVGPSAHLCSGILADRFEVKMKVAEIVAAPTPLM
jgi:hypothetical protein